MKTPRFRLQSVLDMRAAALDEAKNALQEALHALSAAIFAVDQARHEADRYADEICAGSAIQTASQVYSNRQSHLYLTHQILLLQNQVKSCERTVQACRAHVVKTSRDHEILLRLREKWSRAIKYQEDRKEENLLNDLMNTQRFMALAQCKEEYLLT